MLNSSGRDRDGYSAASRSTCVPNIGPRERHRRLVGGIVMLAVAACLAGCLLLFGAPRPCRLLVLLPAWSGALGVFQVSAKTCVALAARGLRNLDAGNETIVDSRERDQVRAQSRQVHMRAALTALVVTALIVWLPL